MKTYKLRSEEFVKFKKKMMRVMLLKTLFYEVLIVSTIMYVTTGGLLSYIWQSPILIGSFVAGLFGLSFVQFFVQTKKNRSAMGRELKEAWDSSELTIGATELTFVSKFLHTKSLSLNIVITKSQLRSIMLAKDGRILCMTNDPYCPYFILSNAYEHHEKVIEGLLELSGKQDFKVISNARMNFYDIMSHFLWPLVLASLLTLGILVNAMLNEHGLSSFIRVLINILFFLIFFFGAQISTQRYQRLFSGTIAGVLFCSLIFWCYTVLCLIAL